MYTTRTNCDLKRSHYTTMYCCSHLISILPITGTLIVMSHGFHSIHYWFPYCFAASMLNHHSNIIVSHYHVITLSSTVCCFIVLKYLFVLYLFYLNMLAYPPYADRLGTFWAHFSTFYCLYWFAVILMIWIFLGTLQNYRLLNSFRLGHFCELYLQKLGNSLCLIHWTSLTGYQDDPFGRLELICYHLKWIRFENCGFEVLVLK